VKKFFWCLSGDFNFKSMPDLNDQHREFIDRENVYFQGEPNRNLKQKAEGEEAEAEPVANDNEDEEEKKDLDSD